MKRAGILALALIAAGASVQAQPAGWSLLGFKTVSLGSDRDEIRVDAGRPYRQLQLCAYNAAITMRDFSVFYGNGGRETLVVRSIINAGTCTRNIGLRGGTRHIVRITLRYERFGAGLRTPLVRVMGR